MNYSVFLWYNNTDGIIGHERIGRVAYFRVDDSPERRTMEGWRNWYT